MSILFVFLLFAVLPILECRSEIVFGQSASFSGGVWEAGGRYKAGIEAAFYETNQQGGVNNQSLRLVSVDDQYDERKIAANVAQLLTANNLTAFIGFTGSSTSIAAIPYATAARLPFIGPLTGTAAIRQEFNRVVINVRAGYDHETVAMLKVLVEQQYFRRISLCYQNDSFGIPTRDSIVLALSAIHMTLSGLHSYERLEMASLDYPSLVSNVLLNDPQAIILLGPEGFVQPFLRVFYQRAPGSNVTLMSGSWIGDAARNFLRSNGLDPTHYYQTQIMPHPLSATSALATRYRDALRSFEGAAASYDYISLEGYAVGRLAVLALQQARTLSSEGLLAAFYSTRMFSVSELVAGPLSDTCTSSRSASGRSSLCYCNQALRFAAVTRLTSSFDFEVVEETLSYPISECFSPASLTRPFLIKPFLPADSSTAQRALETVALALTASGTGAALTEATELNGTRSANNATVTQALAFLLSHTLLMGVLSGTQLEEQSTFPVFRLFTQPALPAGPFSRTTIHLLATLQQELLANAIHMARFSPTSTRILLYSDRYLADYRTDVVAIVSESLHTAGVSLDAAVAFRGRPMPPFAQQSQWSSAASMQAALLTLPNSCDLVVLGITSASEAALLFEYLRGRTGISVYLPFQDVALYWDALQCVGNCERVHARVLFSTNLPNWMQSSTSTFVERYQSDCYSIAPNLTQPMTAVGYLLGRVIDVLEGYAAHLSQAVDGELFLHELYETSVVKLNDLTFGPFEDEQCSFRDCLCNVGARSINTLRVQSINDGRAAEATYRFSGCTVDYTKQTKSYTVVLAVVVPAVVSLLVALVCVYVFLRIMRSRYQVLYAPKDGHKKFCSMFVSLKKETLLWEVHPHAMPSILTAADRIVREAAARTKCYVVKSVGAATLVVSEEPHSILCCASEVSNAISNEPWPAIIAAHAALSSPPDSTEQRGTVHSSDDDTPSTAVTMASWKVEANVGFSIGIHRGTGRIAYADSDNRYDYSGPSVEGAAAASDAAAVDQILVSCDVGTGGFPGANFTDFTTIANKKHEMRLLQFNPVDQVERLFERPREDASNVDSIAAALEQQASGVTTKKVVVLTAQVSAFEFEGQEHSREDMAKQSAFRLQRIHELVQREGGYLQSIVGGQLIVTFNAMRPTPHALRHAVVVAMELCNKDMMLFGEVTCGIASGIAVVGVFRLGPRGYETIVGAVTRTSVCLQQLCPRYGTQVLTVHTAYSEVNECAHVQFVDIVRLPTSTKPIGLVSVECLRSNSGGDDSVGEEDVTTRAANVYLKLLNGANPCGEHVAQALRNALQLGTKCLSLVRVQEIVNKCIAHRSGLDGCLQNPTLLSPNKRTN